MASSRKHATRAAPRSNSSGNGGSWSQIDVFRHDRITGETIRVSVASGGSEANSVSNQSKVSGDGNLVVFVSLAFNLIASDANGVSDIFLRDIAAGTTVRISDGSAGGDADLLSTEPTISRDGRFVAYTSNATNLVPLDTNAKSDVFVFDRTAQTTARVSVSTAGGEANNNSRGAALSRDGRFVSFLSTASNLVPNFTNNVFVRDVQSQTTLHPPSVASPISAKLSGDGRFLVEYASSQAMMISEAWSLPACSPRWREKTPTTSGLPRPPAPASPADDRVVAWVRRRCRAARRGRCARWPRRDR
jgi:Tol biopolymer transport system component